MRQWRARWCLAGHLLCREGALGGPTQVESRSGVRTVAQATLPRARQNATVNWIMARGWRRILVCVIGLALAYRGAVGTSLSISRHDWWWLGASLFVCLFGLLGVVSIILPPGASER
jgi:hypothetical protein